MASAPCSGPASASPGRPDWGLWGLALALPIAAAVVLFEAPAVVILGAAVGSAVFADVVFARAFPPRRTGSLSYAIFLGLMLALTLPATAPLGAAATGAVLAVAAGRFVGDHDGGCRWQPVLVGRVLVQLIFAADLSLATAADSSARAWRAPSSVAALRRAADGMLDAGGEHALRVLLRDALPPWEVTVLGAAPGGIGETCGIAIVVAGLYLIYRGVLRWELPAGALAAAVFMAAVCPLRTGPHGAYEWFPGWRCETAAPLGLAYLLYHLTAGQLLFGAFLLAADPGPAPRTRREQAWFGAGVGAITMFIRLYGPLECESCWAILGMNVIAPLLGRRRRAGERCDDGAAR